jgi:thiol-disulfide isomerase/thioredoxin
LSVLFCFSVLATAAEQPPVTLKVGDPAPPLKVSKWIKGTPVQSLEKGKIYVMEFWATWCGPCIAAMPHVTELQKKYADKGVTVIGMNVWERDLSKPEPFVEKNAAKMGYAVAMDVVAAEGQPGVMARTWMQAAGRNGIPCSFIVDRDSKIAWIGHPMTMERPLALIADNKFDPAKEAEFEKTITELSEKLSTAARAKDYDAALLALDQLIAADPHGAPMREGIKLTLLIQKGDFDAANALAAKLGAGSDPAQATRAAYTLLQVPDKAKIDTDLTLKLAQQGAAKASPDDLLAHMTLAKAHAAKGDYAKAAAVQEELMKNADPTYKDRLQKDLDEYKSKAK